jgi:trigger factor
MQVSVETTQGLQRRMTVQVPAERIDKEVDSRLRSLGGRVRLDGFRPGKVPFKVLQKRYGDQVRSEVLGEVLQATYSEAVSNENLRPAGVPQIEPKQMDAGQDLEYVATFEVLPEFEVQGAEGVALRQPTAEVGDADIDEVLENLRKQQTAYKEVKRAAKPGDQVLVDFTGEIDGEPFAGNEGKDIAVTIGSGQMPPEFEEALKGVKTGDTKDIEYTFPPQFPDKDVAEKTAVFHTTVKSVQAPELPDVDDEFAAKIGIKEGGAAALRDRIKENLERQRDQAVRAQLKRQVMDRLVEANPIELPQALVDGEIEQLRNQAKARMQQSGVEGEPDLPNAAFEDEARRRVTLGLLINEIVRRNDIKLDQARLRQMLEEIASGYDQPQEVLRYYAQNRKLMEGIEVAALEDQVVDWVVERAKLEHKQTTFKALMGGETADGQEGQE